MEKGISNQEKYFVNSCNKIKKNIFTLQIPNSCIPDFIKNNIGRKIYKDGPNCWGTSMSQVGFMPTPRFVWPEEIRYWHEDTPLCKKLSVQDSPRAGDIMNIYSPEYLFEYELNPEDAGKIFWETKYPGRNKKSTIADANRYTGFHRLIHSEVYVSDLLAFGKDSPSKDDMFKLKKIIETYGRPRDNKYCQENPSLLPNFREYNNQPNSRLRSGQCPYFSQVYRCEGFNSYISKQLITNPQKELLEDINELNSINELLHPQIFEAKMTSTQKEESIKHIEKAKELSQKALSTLKLNQKNKNTEMIATQLYFTAESILKFYEFSNILKK